MARSQRLLAALVLVTTFAPVAGRCGEIRGRVILSPGATRPQRAALNPYPGMSSATDDAAAPAGVTPADAVVYLERNGGPSGITTEGRSAADRPELRQINYSFDPRVLGVPVGTTVSFPNADPVFHNVFSYSKARKFDLGYYGRGKSKSVTFDEPGLVKVFCDIHSHMSAFILVVESERIARPDASGAFALVDVPEGEWTLHAWHPERGERERTVTVTEGATTVDIQL